MLRSTMSATCVMVLALPALAADTIETWDPGAGNFELHSGIEGFGANEEDRAIGGEVVMGWGVATRFSAYLATAMSADGYLSEAETAMHAGAFGTPVDTRHFDVDVLLDMSVAGAGGEAVVMPALELNLDREPDLAAYGIYVRGAAAISGGKSEKGQLERHVDLGLTLGSYWTVHARHQLLLEYDATVHDAPEPGNPPYEHGTLGLGYNATLHANLEMITEVRMSISQASATRDFGLRAGFIATLPGIVD